MSDEESPDYDEQEEEEDEVEGMSDAEKKDEEDENMDEEKLEGEHKMNDEVIETPLTKTDIKENLKMLAQLRSDLQYAYIKLECNDREITDISLISEFINLRYVDLSSNLISNIAPISSLLDVIYVNLESNNLEKVEMEPLHYLQVLNVSKNRIKTIDGILHQNLVNLNLSVNQITEMTGLNGPLLNKNFLFNLQTLDLSNNQLTTTAGFDLPNLKILNLARNEIVQIEQMDQLTNLTKLYLEENRLEKLNGFSDQLVALHLLNISGNSISKTREVRNLQCLSNLVDLRAADNACSEDEDYRMEVLAYLRKLVRLDEEKYEEEEREEAEAVLQQKLEEEKQELLRAEEERLAAENEEQQEEGDEEKEDDEEEENDEDAEED